MMTAKSRRTAMRKRTSLRVLENASGDASKHFLSRNGRRIKSCWGPASNHPPVARLMTIQIALRRAIWNFGQRLRRGRGPGKPHTKRHEAQATEKPLTLDHSAPFDPPATNRECQAIRSRSNESKSPRAWTRFGWFLDRPYIRSWDSTACGIGETPAWRLWPGDHSKFIWAHCRRRGRGHCRYLEAASSGWEWRGTRLGIQNQSGQCLCFSPASGA